ncbi:MAG: 4Fe-4S binding protein [Thermodesulfobacteriota bacterium]
MDPRPLALPNLKHAATEKTFRQRFMQTKNLLMTAQNYRRAVQAGFLITVLWIGVDFIGFVETLESGKIPSIRRPPGVEAFLPISALISLKYWILTGIINPIHPAGLLIFLMILGTALVLKKGFCSWVCPFGLFSEILAKAHHRLFGRTIHPPLWLDLLLRSLKYLILLFFFWAILVQMDGRSLETFIYSPYNRVADIKMLKFFTQISTFSLGVIILLILFSILLPYFWCRYLCPYGALLGILSLLSPARIRRENALCIGCEKCTRACPSRIRIHEKKSVCSDECHACMNCIDICPVPGALHLSFVKTGRPVKPWIYATLVLLIFVGGSSLGKAAGYWQNDVPIKEYLFHMHHLNLPVYQHHRGSVPEYDRTLYSHPGPFPKKRFQDETEVHDETH